ncbi:hypothetical protein AAHA92_04036 [Salvia divinorum]|uniref:Uncharacterized protein n=1 Tax=Salvia divinorum TaxID=28513 RepID=A0ABD1I0D8_SALDI
MLKNSNYFCEQSKTGCGPYPSSDNLSNFSLLLLLLKIFLHVELVHNIFCFSNVPFFTALKFLNVQDFGGVKIAEFVGVCSRNERYQT